MSVPSGLSARSTAFWTDVTEMWVIEDPAARTLLELACVALDRGEQARALLDAEGLTITDRYGQMKPHPAASVEHQARLAVARLLRELRLLEVPADDETRVGRRGR